MTEDEMVGWHHQMDGHEFEHQPACSPHHPPENTHGRETLQVLGMRKNLQPQLITH